MGRLVRTCMLLLLFLASEALAVTNVGGTDYTREFAAITTEDINSTQNYPSADIAGDSIVFDSNYSETNYTVDWSITLSLTNDAKFADGNFTLEMWAGGAGTGDINDTAMVTCPAAGCAELVFTFQESPQAGAEGYVLSGSNIAGQKVNFITAQKNSGTTIQIKADIKNAGGVLQWSTPYNTLFQYTENLVPVSAAPIGPLGLLVLFAGILGIGGWNLSGRK